MRSHGGCNWGVFWIPIKTVLHYPGRFLGSVPARSKFGKNELLRSKSSYMLECLFCLYL